MAAAAVAVAVLNAVDAGATTFFISTGAATEGNPVMACCWNVSPAFFVAVKMALACTAVCAFFAFRAKALARFGMGLASAAYAAVCGFHVVGAMAH